MNVTARKGIFFIPCCVYIPAEPPLMGLESLKMCFSWPGKLLAGRMCRDLCIFDAAWGGVELWKGCMTYLESRGIQTTRHAAKREKSFSHCVCVCVCVCQREACKVCSFACSSLPAGDCAREMWHTQTNTHTQSIHQREFLLLSSFLSLLCINVCILLHGLRLILSRSLCFI